MNTADIAQYGAPLVSGGFALFLGWWQSRRKKAEDQAEAQAAEIRAAHRAEVDGRIKSALDLAADAVRRLEGAQREWLDGHHRIRQSVTDGLVEAYERLRAVETKLAVVEDRTGRNEDA